MLHIFPDTFSQAADVVITISLLLFGERRLRGSQFGIILGIHELIVNHVLGVLAELFKGHI